MKRACRVKEESSGCVKVYLYRVREAVKAQLEVKAQVNSLTVLRRKLLPFLAQSHAHLGHDVIV